MRLSTYNIEWFNALFDEADRPLADDGWSARWNITRADQSAAIATVLRAVDADATLIVEAPDNGRKRSTVTALERFAAAHRLRQSRAIIGFSNDTQQELALLYDPARLSVRHDPQEIGAPRFDGEFKWDVDVDAIPEAHVFSKPPLELALEAGGQVIRLIGVHAKSKSPHGARNRDHQIRLSIANRRKQLAQCVWLRRRVEAHLEAGAQIIVLGDFNDGPGLDEYERLFGRSGVEVVLGPDTAPDRQLFDPHAARQFGPGRQAAPATARFYDREAERYFNALLDFIMLSPGLRQSAAPVWRIWHPFDDPPCFADPALSRALLTASDHFPVTVDLEL